MTHFEMIFFSDVSEENLPSVEVEKNTWFTHLQGKHVF